MGATQLDDNRASILRGLTTAGSDSTLHELVAIATSSRPNAVAVIDASGSLTYSQLEIRSRDYAHALVAAGVRHGDFVGICMQRSNDLVAALLATLRVGAAFVGLDPNYPSQRLHAVMASCGVALAICDDRGVSRMPAHVVVVHTNSCEGSIAPRTPRVGSAADPCDLAYAFTTSGSCGTPKAVLIAHRSAVNLIEWSHSAFDSTTFERVLWSTSVAFDLSIFEVFAPLTRGATVVIAESLFDLGSVPHLAGVTLVNTVPSLLAEYLRESPLPKSVHTVCLAGEQVPADLVQQLHAQTQCDVFNLYGPTETTTYSTAAYLPPGDSTATPIGLPIHNTEIMLVDAQLKPVDIGEAGEILIAGVGLARDILGEVGTSDPKFVELNRHRWFRTGDNAIVGPDGQLTFLGRSDSQVKVHGVRIEPSDVETALRTHPSIVDAVVSTVREDGGTLQLAAAIVISAPITSARLRLHLTALLPFSMIPTRVAIVDAIPRLLNSKVDRQAVDQTLATAMLTTSHLAPARAIRIEQHNAMPLLHDVATCWKAALQLGERPSFDDDFFDLGGTSLLAVRVIAHTEARFGVRLPIGTLVTHPSLAQFARRVDEELRRRSRRPAEAVRHSKGTETRQTPLVFLVAWPGDLFRLRRLIENFGSGRDIYSVAMNSPTYSGGALRSIAAMSTAICAELANVFPAIDSAHFVGHSFGGPQAVKVAHL